MGVDLAKVDLVCAPQPLIDNNFHWWSLRMGRMGLVARRSLYTDCTDTLYHGCTRVYMTLLQSTVAPLDST